MAGYARGVHGSGRRVVMTGAAGLIGTGVAPLLSGLWDLHLTDRTAGVGSLLDVCDPGACRAAFEGSDAVIHLAGVPDPGASWDSLYPANVLGAYRVAQAAIDTGVRRLVLASSVQVVAGYPEAVQTLATDPPLPENLYGATKVWAEALGAWVAMSSATSVVALRLGLFAQEPPRGANLRTRGAWLSPRDCAQLLRKAVEVEGIRFLVANGTSANRHPAVDLSATTEHLDYHPVDDAWGISSQESAGD
jgi:nucleoside-diphosphate-sugar epimerase